MKSHELRGEQFINFQVYIIDQQLQTKWFCVYSVLHMVYNMKSHPQRLHDTFRLKRNPAMSIVQSLLPCELIVWRQLIRGSSIRARMVGLNSSSAFR